MSRIFDRSTPGPHCTRPRQSFGTALYSTWPRIAHLRNTARLRPGWLSSRVTLRRSLGRPFTFTLSRIMTRMSRFHVDFFGDEPRSHHAKLYCRVHATRYGFHASPIYTRSFNLYRPSWWTETVHRSNTRPLIQKDRGHRRPDPCLNQYHPARRSLRLKHVLLTPRILSTRHRGSL